MKALKCHLPVGGRPYGLTLEQRSITPMSDLMPTVHNTPMAIDIDADQLKVARDRLDESGVTNCSFVASDAYTLNKLWPTPVNFVFMANAFHGVPDKPRLARAVREALKLTGQFAIVNWHPRPREETIVLGEPRGPRTELRMSPDQTIEAAEVDGLKFSKLVDVPPYHYAIILERSV